MLRGLPQGAPTSPFLSALSEDYAVRDHFKTMGLEIKKYADDWIAMSKKKFALEDVRCEEMEKAGIELNLEKSGFVKYDGKWLKPLKFLGLEYDGCTLKANTRNGSRLIYDKASLLEAIDQGYLTGGRGTSNGRRTRRNT